MVNKKPKINEIPKLDDYLPDDFEGFQRQFNLIHRYAGINIEKPTNAEKDTLFLSLQIAMGPDRYGFCMQAKGNVDFLWTKLAEQYSSSPQERLYDLERELQGFVWEENNNVDKYTTRYNNILQRILNIVPDYQLTDLKTFTTLYNGLPKETKQGIPHVNPIDTSSKKLVEILRH